MPPLNTDIIIPGDRRYSCNYCGWPREVRQMPCPKCHRESAGIATTWAHGYSMYAAQCGKPREIEHVQG
jgi:hypothetical protein